MVFFPIVLGIPGNDYADQLTKNAAISGKTYLFSPLLLREKSFIRGQIFTQ